MGKEKAFLFSGLLLIAFAIIFPIIIDINIFWPLLLTVCGTIIIFIGWFESSNVTAEKLVLIAVMSGLASGGRVLFSAIPSAQPSSFIVIMTGMVFGPQAGFMTGAVCAFTSNLLLGQGPWTPWQMFCWGMMGLFAGIFAKQLKANIYLLIIYGAAWGIMFGWIMNLWYIIGFTNETIISGFIAACIASFPFDAIHSAANVLLIIFFSKKFICIFDRIAYKYKLI